MEKLYQASPHGLVKHRRVRDSKLPINALYNRGFTKLNRNVGHDNFHNIHPVKVDVVDSAGSEKLV